MNEKIYHATEIDKTEQYVKDLCKKIKNPIVLAIKDKNILCALFTNEEKQLNKEEEY